jgi:hypothetical protein
MTSTSPAASVPAQHHMMVGVDLYVDHRYTMNQIMEWGPRDVNYVTNELGLSAISIDWAFIIPSYTASNVIPSSFVTPPPNIIEYLTQLARAAHLRVNFRVLFWVSGRIEPLRPANQNAFFDSLLSAEAPYMQLAQKYHVNEFITGTERTTLEESPRWTWFFTVAAKIYSGTLSYAMWGGEPHDGGFFWGQNCSMPIEVCGITAYPNTFLPNNASQQQVTQAWENVLSRIPMSVLARTEINEIGIPAVQGAYQKPWNFSLTGTEDDQVQARWFTGVCQAAKAYNMLGVWFYPLPVEQDPYTLAAPSDISGTGYLSDFGGRKSSEEAIKNCATE